MSFRKKFVLETCKYGYYLVDRWSGKLRFKAIISDATILNWFSLKRLLDSAFAAPLSTTPLPFSPGQLLGLRPSLPVSSSMNHCWIFFIKLVCVVCFLFSSFLLFLKSRIASKRPGISILLLLLLFFATPLFSLNRWYLTSRAFIIFIITVTR